MRVPFYVPSVVGAEHEYVRQAMESPQLAGDGPFSRRVEALLERETGVARCLLTPSCTHALEMSALLLGIGPDCEVIVPSFTFVSSANAFALLGAKPVFADCDARTFNIDPAHVERLVTKRTRGIVVVHYGGVGCDMERIGAIAEPRGIPIIEDNAHGLFGKYRGRQLGTFGAVATQSFHATKNYSCGEGGALLINDRALIERAEIIREKGTNRSNFFRGQVDKYTWMDLGSSYLLSELNAAYLLGQLEAAERVQARRKHQWDRYHSELASWAGDRVQRPLVPEWSEPPHHVYTLLMPSLESRTRFIEHMRAREITTPFHYLPLHLSDMGRKFGGREGDCPVTEDVSDRLVRLPLFHSMTEAQQDHVIESSLAFSDF